jgi:hypothetical protein
MSGCLPRRWEICIYFMSTQSFVPVRRKNLPLPNGSERWWTGPTAEIIRGNRVAVAASPVAYYLGAMQSFLLFCSI